MKRAVLGKGIAAIIGNEPTSDNQFLHLDIDMVYPNPYQPRKAFNPESIRELADSMKESGLIQPVVVYRKDGKYFLIVGERRWRAAQLLKWEKIPAVIKEVQTDEVIVGALVENIQRQDLNAIEVSHGIELMMEKTNFTHQQVAEKLGMSRTAVTNFLRLLKLPENIQGYLVSGEFDQGHARALLSLSDSEDIVAAANTIIQKNYSVRQAEDLVRHISRQKQNKQESDDPDLQKVEDKLTKLLSTQVKLKYTASSGKGKIEIFFANLTDFERIVGLIAKENE